jgi:hypothetical protein
MSTDSVARTSSGAKCCAERKKKRSNPSLRGIGLTRGEAEIELTHCGRAWHDPLYDRENRHHAGCGLSKGGSDPLKRYLPFKFVSFLLSLKPYLVGKLCSTANGPQSAAEQRLRSASLVLSVRSSARSQYFPRLSH